MSATSTNVYILVGTVILTLMGFGMILFVYIYQKQRLQREIDQQFEMQKLKAEIQLKLLENSLEVQEFERRRIAKDLHDEVGALLSASRMSINLLLKNEKNNLVNKESIQNVKTLVDESISVVRNISKDLVPRTLENFGLITAIDEFIQKIHLATEINFEFNYGKIDENERYDSKIELGIFRIIQELTNNSIKHSKAIKISIDLSNESDYLKIKFWDNGIGFDYNEKIKDQKSGLGIKNMQSRIEVLGGNISFDSNKNIGTLIEIEIRTKT